MDYHFSFVAAYCAMYSMCALFCLVLLARTSDNVGSDLEMRFFRIMLLSLTVYSVVETVWVLGNFGYSAFIWRLSIPLSILNHFMVMSICIYWFFSVEAHLHSPLIDRRSRRILLALPLIAAMVVVASSIWTGAVFFMQPDGTTGRGPAYFPVLLITYAYPVVATVRLFVAGARSSTAAKRRELFVMASFALPPATVGVVDSIIPMLPIVAPAFFLSLLIIFTTLQEAQISHDALTDLNNRRRADRYFDENISLATTANPFYYFVIDGDRFKEINDTYGHLEGDAALCAIADAIREVCNDRNVHAARWGGDEFVIMGFAADIGDPDAFIRQLQACLERGQKKRSAAYRLGVTAGYASCADPSQGKRAIVEGADRMLYERKQERDAAKGAK